MDTLEHELRNLPGRPLDDFQVHDIKHIINNDGQCLYASCLGSRKTGTTVALMAVTGGTWVVVCPLGTIGNNDSGWVSSIKEWAPHATIHIMGTKNKTDLIDLKEDKPAPGELSIHLVGWEYARKIDWRLFKNINGVALDEVHRMAGFNTATAKAVWKMNSKYRIGLSGTPANNKLHGLYNVLHWIWWGNNDHKTANRFRRFAGMWTIDGRPGWVARHFELIKKPNFGGIDTGYDIGRELRFHSVIDEIPCYIQHLEDEACCEFHPNGVNATLPKRIEPHVIYTDMTPAQARIYRKVNDGDTLLWLDSDNPDKPREATVVGDEGLVKRIRLRQIALAVPSVVEGGIAMKEDAKSSKADALLDLLPDIVADDEPVVVYTHSKVFAKMVTARINRRFGADIRAITWSGEMSQAERNRVKANFGDAGEPNVIVAVISAIGEGVDGLQLKSRREVWLSFDESMMLNNQAQGRLWRTGQKRRVQVWWIITKGTLEETQVKNHARRNADLKQSLRANV